MYAPIAETYQFHLSRGRTSCLEDSTRLKINGTDDNDDGTTKKDFDDYHIDEFLVPGTLTGTRDEEFINMIVIKILLGSAVVVVVCAVYFERPPTGQMELVCLCNGGIHSRMERI
jgi:hypothetical protein